MEACNLWNSHHWGNQKLFRTLPSGPRLNTSQQWQNSHIILLKQNRALHSQMPQPCQQSLSLPSHWHLCKSISHHLKPETRAVLLWKVFHSVPGPGTNCGSLKNLWHHLSLKGGSTPKMLSHQQVFQDFKGTTECHASTVLLLQPKRKGYLS